MITNIILSVIIIVGVLYYLFPIIQVVGDSMYPTYCDAEFLIGTRIFYKSKLKKGDVIVYHSPEGRIVIKRIEKILTDKVMLNKTPFNEVGTYFYCVGDNSGCSYDSRNYGYISSKDIVCKIKDQRRNLNDVCNQEGRNA